MVFRALWNGKLPLKTAFWEHAILYAGLANFFASAGSLLAFALDAPVIIGISIFVLPIPYIVVACVGVWRSADVYQGPDHWAYLARVVALLWGALMSFT